MVLHHRSEVLIIVVNLFDCTIIFIVAAYALVWRSLSWCVAWFAGAALLQGGMNNGIDCKPLLSICLQVMPGRGFLGC